MDDGERETRLMEKSMFGEENVQCVELDVGVLKIVINS